MKIRHVMVEIMPDQKLASKLRRKGIVCFPAHAGPLVAGVWRHAISLHVYRSGRITDPFARGKGVK